MTHRSTTPLIVETAALETVTFDIYRDIHKGIRAELFAVTLAPARSTRTTSDAVRPSAPRGPTWCSLLVQHAEHEDDFVQPIIERFTPRATPRRSPSRPPRLEAQMAELEVLADRAAGACAEQAPHPHPPPVPGPGVVHRRVPASTRSSRSSR